MAIDIEAPGADEAELKAAIQALANDITVVPLAVNTTLDSTHYGKLVNVTAAAVVITFPAAPATRQTLDVINTSAGSITVNGAPVASGKTVSYISISSAWREISSNDQGVMGKIASTIGYIYPIGFADNVASAASVANTIYALPFEITHGCTVDRLAFRTNSTVVAASNAKIAIYRCANFKDGPVGNPVIDSGNMTTATAGNDVEVTGLNTYLPAGLYFICVWTSAAVTFNRSSGTSRDLALAKLPISNSFQFFGGGSLVWTKSLTYGAWPTLTGVPATDWSVFNGDCNNMPGIAMGIF